VDPQIGKPFVKRTDVPVLVRMRRVAALLDLQNLIVPRIFLRRPNRFVKENAQSAEALAVETLELVPYLDISLISRAIVVVDTQDEFHLDQRSKIDPS
jgi:hypothetical protein